MLRNASIPVSMLTLVLALVGCAGPMRTVTLRATHADAPLAGAHVRLTALDTGTVPLPANLETIEEYMSAYPDTAVTDAQGNARVRMYAKRPHAIEVIAPPFGELGGRGPWIWVLAADGSTTRRVRQGGEANSDEVSITVGP